MDNAAGVVCCDTGLGHLAAALDLPSVSFYGPTDAKLIGTLGLNQKHIIASSETYRCAPCYRRSCDFTDKKEAMAACMASFSPQTTWNELQQLINNANR
jgi:heptosyltransferase-1